MDKKAYETGISSILPERDEFDDNFDSTELRSSTVQSASSAAELKHNAAVIAKMKLKEKYALKKAEEKATAKAEAEKAIAQENLATLEVIESSPDAQAFLAGSNDITPYSGTTKKDVVKLLNSLNINLSLHLTKNDTYNLLSCLLTANESQLLALYNNNKTPLAIKTVIKRIMDDAKLGNIETVEKLWDRIFGKTDKMMLNMPQTQEMQIQGLPGGIIPNTVVSREAYTIIRDTIIGK